MTEITMKVVDAFLQGENLRISNSRSLNGSLYVHDQVIAQWRKNELWISIGSDFTNTKMDRLNGLPWVELVKENGKLYINGKPWDGGWIKLITKNN